MGWNATVFLRKTLKISIESFANQHHSKMKMVKRRSTISLQRAIDFCLDSGDSDLGSWIEGLFSGEEDWIDGEILQESNERWKGKLFLEWQNQQWDTCFVEVENKVCVVRFCRCFGIAF